MDKKFRYRILFSDRTRVLVMSDREFFHMTELEIIAQAEQIKKSDKYCIVVIDVVEERTFFSDEEVLDKGTISFIQF